MWNNRKTHSLLVGMQNDTATLEDSYLFIIKRNIGLSYEPLVTLLGIYLNGLKTYVHTKTCTWMFITALLIIAKTWKQPGCPSIGEWINYGISIQ